MQECFQRLAHNCRGLWSRGARARLGPLFVLVAQRSRDAVSCLCQYILCVGYAHVTKQAQFPSSSAYRARPRRPPPPNHIFDVVDEVRPSWPRVASCVLVAVVLHADLTPSPTAPSPSARSDAAQGLFSSLNSRSKTLSARFLQQRPRRPRCSQRSRLQGRHRTRQAPARWKGP